MQIAGPSTTLDELHHCIHGLREEIRALKEQLRLALRRQFGASSEAFCADQLSLLELTDVAVVITEPEESNDTPSPRKSRTTRQAVIVNRDRPVERIEVDLDEAAKVCNCCGGTLHRIGEDFSYQVELIPAQTKVVETARPKYGCRGGEAGVKQAPLPAQPIPKSMASASLLAYLIVSKYVDHIPLNRLEQILKRHGIILPRSIQCDWLMACATLLKPLVASMRSDLLK